MATPPKSPSGRMGPKKVASPVKVPDAIVPSVKKTSVPDVPPALAKPQVKAPAVPKPPMAAKPMPFVIEPEVVPVPVVAAPAPLVEPKIIQQSESVASEPAAPVIGTPEVQPTEVAPIVETLVEIEAPTPPQPVAVAPLAAAIEAAAEWQKPHALEGKNIMNEAIQTSQKFAEDAKSRIQTMVSGFNDKAKVAMEKSSKTAEELSDIAKGNVEAFVESSKIAAKGFETLGQSAAEYGRASFEKTSATLKSFASVKSPTEFFQLQSELLTSAFDAMAAETAKSTEAFMKLAGDIAQPLSSRAAIVSDKIKSLAA